MKRLGLIGMAAVGCICLRATAATTTVSKIEDMPTSGGEGTIKYTGESGTVETALALTPGSEKAATLDVATGTTLTFANKLSATGGAFVKSGGGTLELKYPGAFTLGESNVTASKYQVPLVYSDGNVTQGAAALTIADGKLSLGREGQKVTTKAIFIGANGPWTVSPMLEILGGTFTGAAAYVDAGTSTAASPAGAQLKVSGGAQVTLSDLQVTTGGNGSYKGRPVVTTTGAGTKLTVTGYSHIGNLAANTEYTLNTLDGSTFDNNRNNMDGGYVIGVVLGKLNVDRRGIWNIRGEGSVGQTYQLYVSRCSELNVTEGGSLYSDRTAPHMLRGTKDKDKLDKVDPFSFSGDEQLGDVHFDKAYLSSRSIASLVDWFTGITNYTVGAGGLTIGAKATFSSLAGHSVYATEAARTAKSEIVVTNAPNDAAARYLAIGAGEVPIRVKGAIRPQILVDGRYNGSRSTGRIIQENASNAIRLMVGGDNALQNMVFDASGTTTRFRHVGIESDRPRWATVASASVLSSSMIRIGGITSDASSPGWGAAWLRQKVPVDRSFTIEWTWYSVSSNPFGVAAVFQNATDGCHTLPGSGHLCGYDTHITSSCAVAYDYRNSCHRFGTNGTWTQSDDLGTWTQDGQQQPARATAGADDPTRMTITYDAEAKTLTYSSYYPNKAHRKTSTFSVDLAATVGANEAYFGFTGGSVCKNVGGGTENLESYHAIGDVRLSHEQGRSYQRVGGKAEVAAGRTWTVHPLCDLVNRGFVMNELSYGDGAQLSVLHATQTGLTSADAQKCSIGFDRISGTGTLYKDNKAKLALSEPGAATNASVVVNAGGLVLRREDAERPSFKAADGGWCFNGPSVYWAGDRSLQIGPLTYGNSDGGLKAKELTVGASTRRRYRVDGAWKAKFHVYADSASGNNGQGYSFIIHNDPHGCEARATDLAGGRNVQNAAELRRWTYFDGKGDFAHVCVGTSGVVPGRSGETESVLMSGIDLRAASGAEEDVLLEHLPLEKQLKLTVTQGANVYTHTFDFDVLSAINDEKYGYLSFSVRGGDSTNTRFVFSDFEFDPGQDVSVEKADVPFFGTLAAGSGTSELPVELETDVTNVNFRVAATPLALKANDTVAVTASRAPAVADLDRVVCAGAATVRISDGCAAKVAQVTPSGDFTVDGGVLVLSAANVFPEDARIRLVNGAKLKLDYAGAQRLRAVYVNGRRVASGAYSSADWIAEGGAGTLALGKGLILLVK